MNFIFQYTHIYTTHTYNYIHIFVSHCIINVIVYGLGGGVDVALRLSYQTPLLLPTFMKSQEVSVGLPIGKTSNSEQCLNRLQLDPILF